MFFTCVTYCFPGEETEAEKGKYPAQGHSVSSRGDTSPGSVAAGVCSGQLTALLSQRQTEVLRSGVCAMPRWQAAGVRHLVGWGKAPWGSRTWDVTGEQELCRWKRDVLSRQQAEYYIFVFLPLVTYRHSISLPVSLSFSFCFSRMDGDGKPFCSWQPQRTELGARGLGADMSSFLVASLKAWRAVAELWTLAKDLILLSGSRGFRIFLGDSC